MRSDDTTASARLAPPTLPLSTITTVITTFLLVRHAESEANAAAYFGSQRDVPLSERGRAQVTALTHALSGLQIDAVLSSDLSRALDTVAPLAAERGLTVITTPRLRERAMGVFTGMSFDDARAQYPEVWKALVARDPFIAPEGGESHHALYQRMASVLDELYAQHRGQAVLIGSHGVAIHHMLRHLLGLEDIALPLWTAVDNASVSRIDIYEREGGQRSPRLVYANRLSPGTDQQAF